MHLLRIQVPDFRVLKDVDICFEKEFSPRIFPLGSQNGGGKSTLLQLVFVLLHCSGSRERRRFLKNMLKGFKPSEGDSKKTLATIDIWDGEKEVRMEFLSCRDSYLKELGKDEDNGANSSLTFSDLSETERLRRRIPFSALPEHKAAEMRLSRLKSQVSELSEVGEQLDSIRAIEHDEERNRRYVNFILSENLKRRFNLSDESTIQECEREIERELSCLESELAKQNEKHKRLSEDIKKIREYLQSGKLTYITNYSANDGIVGIVEKEVLLCKIESLNTNEAESLLHRLSEKVFLAAPFTQVYLFLPKPIRKDLFREVSPDREDYYSHLKKANAVLPGFFTYDFFPVNLIIKSLKAARDQDTKELIETGAYGNRFRPLLDDLNSILAGKKLNVGPDLSKVIFETDRDNEIVELYPEDLSHGELKRLSLYMWTKYNKIEDAIVLMDEIEIALHPDWQYQIVRDLMRWTPNNQYILATHSFDLCEALTPAHVKELEPKLLKRTSD